MTTLDVHDTAGAVEVRERSDRTVQGDADALGYVTRAQGFARASDEVLHGARVVIEPVAHYRDGSTHQVLTASAQPRPNNRSAAALSATMPR